MKLDHLIWPRVGWGYMEAHESTFNVFRHVSNVAKPKTWLEIGFHLGHSTTYTLEIMPEVKVTGLGVTNCSNANRYEIGDNMKSIYGDRFEYYLGDPPDIRHLLKGRTFDVAFIDGDHKYGSAVNDITACMEMKIPYILVDNCELGQVNLACEDTLGVYNYDKLLYNSTWSGAQILEARLYHVQYNDI